MPSTLTLDEWLVRIEQAHPPSIELGLERISRIADHLGLRTFSCPVITIGGTNGKGSCVALSEHIFISAGYRVATYTSPHLLHFQERIRLNGLMIDEDRLCEAFNVIEQTCNQIRIHLTYFEFITLAALFIFQQIPLDVIILEVGLGGRLDAVNIIDPDLAIIASISIDHTDYLGSDRESIAREKAGIMRQGKPVVCGDLNPPDSLLSRAYDLNAPLFIQGKDFHYTLKNNDWDFIADEIVLKDLPLPRLLLQNAATTIMALHLLRNRLPISLSAIIQGLQTVQIPGRFQIIEGRVTQIFDVAHNPDSVLALAKQLQEKASTGKKYAVWSMLADKDLKTSIQMIAPEIDAWFVAPLKNVKRAATIEQLQTAFDPIQDYIILSSIIEAYHQAMDLAVDGDRIIIFGSFHTVADVLREKRL
jgi:dihydrofolate synthase/folylpolyglutamate synthase